MPKTDIIAIEKEDLQNVMRILIDAYYLGHLKLENLIQPQFVSLAKLEESAELGLQRGYYFSEAAQKHALSLHAPADIWLNEEELKALFAQDSWKLSVVYPYWDLSRPGDEPLTFFMSGELKNSQPLVCHIKWEVEMTGYHQATYYPEVTLDGRSLGKEVKDLILKNTETKDQVVDLPLF
jgi:hypothetical protein